jgi:hypothetical protein
MTDATLQERRSHAGRHRTSAPATRKFIIFMNSNSKLIVLKLEDDQEPSTGNATSDTENAGSANSESANSGFNNTGSGDSGTAQQGASSSKP